MSMPMKVATFRVEFDKVCSACGAECPHLEIQEFEVNYGFPETKKRRKCKNEKICRDAVLSEYVNLKKRFEKEFEVKGENKDDKSREAHGAVQETE